MRIGEGIVEEIKDDGLAKVRISRDHLYVACSECFGAERVYLTAKNPIAATEGQNVRYEVEDGPLTMGAFMCFVVPLVFLAAGAIFGYTMSGGAVELSVVGAIIGTLISAIIVKKYDTVLGRHVDTQATITSLIVPEEDEEDDVKASA